MAVKHLQTTIFPRGSGAMIGSGVLWPRCQEDVLKSPGHGNRQNAGPVAWLQKEKQVRMAVKHLRTTIFPRGTGR